MLVVVRARGMQLWNHFTWGH